MKALRYHGRRPTGNTQITAAKPCGTATDLALACTPGVATPCRAIQRNLDSVYRDTNKGNLVAIMSNGATVLGLGNLGPLAAKPVMEGKSLLFKRLADIDAFDLELDVVHPEELVRVITVAGASVRTGVASRPPTDLTAYSDSIATRVRLLHEERAHCAPAAPEARHG